MAPKTSPVRKFASARAAISDFIISSFVKDMRATIDDLVNKKGPPFNQSGGEQVAGYLSSQMLTTESDERKQKKREWRGKIRNMLAGKDSKQSRSEQLVKKLAPTVNVIKKSDPSPLVIFINKKSGGRTGSTLLEKLKPWFPLAQVCDLSKYSASDYLKLYSNCSDLRILICGGDGTVGWIMDEALRAFPGHSFNFGVIPLGTGNDLCIQLKDIPKDIDEYSVSEGLDDNNSVNTNPERSSNYVSSQYVIGSSKEQQVVMNLQPSMVIADPSLLNMWYKNPKIVQLDRWAIKVNRVHGRKRKLLKLLLIQNKVKRRGNSIISGLSRIISRFWGFGAQKGNKKNTSPEGTGAKNLTDVDSNMKNEAENSGQLKKSLKKKKKEAMNYTMNNYLGVGVDGAVTLGFHSLRQRVPALFFSRWVNKLWYGMIGVRTLLLGWSRDLSQCCQLICDGEVVKIPEGTQSIIILNINSYAGGMKMWPELSSVYYLGELRVLITLTFT
jgi:Diacylglycerol kinase accessory domain/Diacylglycerol kinase catalytic domain